VTPLRSVELCRRLARVRFRSVAVGPGELLAGAGPGAGADLLTLALVVQAAEMAGAMERSLEMTAAWASERYSFGRPLASYQALKHRFADMRTWLEAGLAIVERAARAVDAGDGGAPELAGAAKAYVADRGVELVQDCVQIHGGIGVTDDHDLHLFLRRVAAGYGLLGTPAEHRRRLGEAVAGRRRATAGGTEA
ncbi:MAG TPA: acyl-CoA dehydrogenase family protein, partial [Acidimicrobiales bacterium]|nr:acyl-CoA dehydrogenase family protein [Acidimicrobiales bacterium]